MITAEVKNRMRLPYSLRRVPVEHFVSLQVNPDVPKPGDIVLASVERIAKNVALELSNGRRCSLYEGDIIAAVYGNRYATLQFEGYARRDGNFCDLLSMGGLCGIVETKHSKVVEPTKLRLQGAVADAEARLLKMADYPLKLVSVAGQPHIIVVCGSSMDAGKTHTAVSIIKGLSKAGCSVAGIKLTGTATGKDTWNMLDAGACVALDFVDGGHPSTYLCDHDELLQLYRLLVTHATAHGAKYAVIEIADGLLQRETSLLLQSPAFTSSVDTWVFAGGDPMAAESGVRVMRNWGIEPIAVSGALTMSSLNMREVEAASGIRCMTARELQAGVLNRLITVSASNGHPTTLRRRA